MAASSDSPMRAQSGTTCAREHVCQTSTSFFSSCLAAEAPQKFGLLEPTAVGPWCLSSPSNDDAFCGLNFSRQDGFQTILANCNAGHGIGNEEYTAPAGTIDACVLAWNFSPSKPFPTDCVKNVLCSTSTLCSVSIASYVAKCGTAASSSGLINMSNYQAWCSSPDLLPF